MIETARQHSREPKELLRRLAASDEHSLQDVVSAESQTRALNRETRALVRLAALLAVDAPIASLRWAVDVASTLGVDDEALVEVLVSAAAAAGAAQMVSGAPRMALALGLDLEGCDGT